MQCLFLIILFLLSWQPNAHARPVSYADGWMFMTMNDPWSNSVMHLYSPTSKFSLGPFVDHYRNTDGALYGLQGNWLAKRWNNFDSQANFYLMSALGYTSEQDLGGYIGSDIDWEDRRFYVAYENRYTFAGEVKEEFQQKARVGIAPYIAEAGGLHTWLMLKVDHMPEEGDKWTATPLVRVFKGDYLAEVGVSNHGGMLFNLYVTF